MSVPSMFTRAELERQTKALYEQASKADPDQTEASTVAVLGRTVFVWTNLTVRQLFALRSAIAPAWTMTATASPSDWRRQDQA